MSLFNSFFTPMLLIEEKKPFNDSNFIFEPKFDGVRALVFIDSNKVIIKNKKGEDISDRYPEIQRIKKTKKPVIFDGEIVLMVNGKPSFEGLQKRILLKDKIRIDKYSKSDPVVFVAFDILYEDKDLTALPLIKRKQILAKYKDTNYFIKTKYIEDKGLELFNFVKKEKLEGMVAKRKDSKYLINTRSKEWIKIKNQSDEDFYICGYREDINSSSTTLLLGKKEKESIVYAGKVPIGRRNPDYLIIMKVPKAKVKAFAYEDDFIYLKPILKCTVIFTEKTKSGHLRQPIYKNLKTD